MSKVNDEVRKWFNFDRNSKLIIIDPVTFAIGGIGSLAVGTVTEYDRYQSSEENEFIGTTLRTLSFPLRCIIRFFGGGFVYMFMDSLIQKVLNMKVPYVAGAITALFFANGSRSGPFLGSVLGMALFCQFAEFVSTSYR